MNRRDEQLQSWFIALGILGTLVFLFFVGDASAQSPEETKIFNQHFHRRYQPVDKLTVTLFTADCLLRGLDAYSTHRLLSDPCKCFGERDPIAPHTPNWGAQIGFQAGMFALVTGSAYMLNRHHHERWAKAVLFLDLASEGIAVGNNLHLASQHGTPNYNLHELK